MNIYETLNKVVYYIENHLDEKISIEKLAHLVGLNSQSLQSIFMFITNLTITEYIRNRRMSKAAEDLAGGESVLQVATKYQYKSAIAFSRSFTNLFHTKPSVIKKMSQLNEKFIYPILQFAENNSIINMSYRIVNKSAFTLYGLKKETNLQKITADAPNFIENISKKYGDIAYGVVEYENRSCSKNCNYWCCYNKPLSTSFVPLNFPSTKWLIFSIFSKEAKDIQRMSYQFYNHFILKNTFKIRDLPEIEVYFKDKVLFMVPIFTD